MWVFMESYITEFGRELIPQDVRQTINYVRAMKLGLDEFDFGEVMGGTIIPLDVIDTVVSCDQRLVTHTTI